MGELADALLTCSEAARLLAVRPATIREWTSRGLIPSIKLGGKAVRYRRGDLAAFVQAGERPARLGASPIERGR